MLAVFSKYFNKLFTVYWSVVFLQRAPQLPHMLLYGTSTRTAYFNHPDFVEKLSTKLFQGTNPTARSPLSNIKKQWQQVLQRRCHYSSSCSVCVDLLPTGMWAHRNTTFIFIIKALQCHRVNVNAVETTPWKHIKRAVAQCPTQNNPRAFAFPGCACR